MFYKIYKFLLKIKFFIKKKKNKNQAKNEPPEDNYPLY